MIDGRVVVLSLNLTIISTPSYKHCTIVKAGKRSNDGPCFTVVFDLDLNPTKIQQNLRKNQCPIVGPSTAQSEQCLVFSIAKLTV